MAKMVLGPQKDLGCIAEPRLSKQYEQTQLMEENKRLGKEFPLVEMGNDIKNSRREDISTKNLPPFSSFFNHRFLLSCGQQETTI